ncbi:oxidoreductase [Sulfurisoma sediminicola]|uniref:Ferredoxin--NADP+ reductase n=1 Tax=Sulfurisoma sediminicola TaxID=1381557 RepID=A0A497XKJ6_9PROT|nr:oxidoreductase [Sulfurisoma sediminicola]RLJ68461.1 ferredoxin--NADP+ reductase [Sulfurisoma sediminicola]
MQTPATDAKIYSAELISSQRITPPASREEVRHMVFRSNELALDSRAGNCIRVLAPGQFGNKYHGRLYSIIDVSPGRGAGAEFSICVRRCSYVDDFSGEEYPGVASNHLCDLRPGASIEFSGPVPYPFAIPEDKNANLLMIGMGTGIAPFRGLIRLIYEKIGGWKGKVRLYFGARSGLEMLYMNDENDDLANYYDQPTFKAFQAVSPRPALGAPVALDRALVENAAEVWDMVQSPVTHVFIAGTHDMLAGIDKAMTTLAGSAARWAEVRQALVSDRRWHELLY